MEDKNVKVILWLNGKKKENSFEYEIENYKTITLSHLKDSIIQYIYNNNIKKEIGIEKEKFDIIYIYTINEINLEENDIQYLKENDLLFFTIDYSNFKESNHYNQYEFQKWIKSGGYGKVYLAKHIFTNKEYAIKKIDTSSFSNTDLYNISREYIILRSFNHPNIIKCYQSFNYENSFYTIMDYAKGGELSNLLQTTKRLNEKNCKNLFKQIYNAVKYIHGQNIIHRDLKPNNILFLDNEKTHIVLIDFGISGFSNGKFKETVKAGTIRFLPPEIVSGKDYASNTKLDIWSLGIILFRMIEGYYPFEGKNEKDIVQKILYSPLEFNKKIKISIKCKKLIIQMLEKNINFRIDTDNESFQNWFDGDELSIKNSKTMKLTSDLFNDHFNERKASIIKTYDTPNRNTIIHHISDYLASDDNNDNNDNKCLPKKRNSFKATFKRNNVLLPKVNNNINTIENNLDNSLEINNNINKFKSRRHSVQNVPKLNIKIFKKKIVKV